MTDWITRLLGVAALGLSAAFAQGPPILVGAVVSESGPHAALAADYRKALILWQEETNAAGGLLARKLELRLLDDGSEAVQTAKLMLQLISQEKVDALIGPYGSAAALMAGAEAESARRVMVNGAAASRSVHKRSPRYVFQAGIPYSAYGAGVLEIARQAGYRKLFIVARDDPAAREMAEAAGEAAAALGLAAGELQVHSRGASDFAALVAAARAAQADAWLAFGEAADAAEMVKSLKRLGYAPKLFFARAAAEPKLISLVGQDAEFSLGTLEYDARFATSASERFVKGFSARWGARPGPAAAQGYAAATVLAEAIRRSGGLDQEKLRAELASAAIATVLGEYRVNPSNGEQISLKPAVIEILRGRPQVVWPRALETAAPVLPYPQWSERQLLKSERR